ncbi:hypothetical protein M8J76_014135 [Diaphorina citri]|nr:hypothetical protein M8J76_014135 [Diaphorina citri]
MFANPGILRECCAAVIANMMSFGLGVINGWTSATHRYFVPDQSPIGPLSHSYFSWLSSIPFLSALLGLFVWGNLSERLGRKPTGFILGLPFTIMYILLCVSHNQTVVLVARFIGGFANVGCIMCVTLYVKEIASAEMRHKLANMFSMSFALGSVYIIAVSAFVSYDTLHWILLSINLLYLLLICFIPESPVYHIKNNDFQKARKSLEWLRKTTDETVLNSEIETLKKLFIKESGIKFLDIFRNKYYFKSMLIATFLQTFILNATAFSCVITFSSYIIQSLMVVRDVSMYNIAFTIFQLFGCLASFFVNNILGRRTFIVSSCITYAVFFFVLGLYSYIPIPYHDKVSLVLIYLYVFLFSAITFPVMYIYFNEIISSESSNHIFTIMMLANMMSFALGLITVWVSACRHYFHSDNSPIGPVSTQYISWAGSIPFLSALLGLFVWGNLSERLGRKPTGFILGLPFTIMYILLCVSHNQTVVLVARFIGGFANVGCIMCVTLYVKEIASAEMRVRLTNIMAVSIVLGSLYVISVSSIVTYEVLHQLLLVWCIVYLILFSFLPETPVYHIRNGNYEKARQSLEWLRQTKDETLISREIEALKETFINKTGIKFLDVFRNKYYFKTMLISVFLQITINNVTGFSVFLTYSSEIFEQLLQDENVAWYNIIFTALQIIGGLITFLVADKFGRRTYIVSSNIILSALLLTLALCQYLEIQVHFERRLAIRQSWGYEKRFSDVPIVTVFILGYDPDNEGLQIEIAEESERYNDIVQAKFIDSYFNNTIKTMMGFKWAANYCKHSKFYFFADDDFYVSTRNVLRFLRNPLQYPQYLELPIETIQSKNNIMDYELPSDVKLFSGFVFVSSPHRHYTSKWYISLQEYPYHLWPPYVTAGAYVVSREVLLDFYFASHFTKHFRFDDIYLGILAKKTNTEPFHCGEFYFYKKDYSLHNYQYVIASHGYGNHDELLRVWNEQRGIGNA